MLLALSFVLWKSSWKEVHLQGAWLKGGQVTWGPQAFPPPGQVPGNGWEGVPLVPKYADQSMRPCASGGSIPTFMSWGRRVSSCPRGSGTPLSAFLQSFCSSCSLRSHLAGIDALHLFSLPQAFRFSAALSYPRTFSDPLVLL